MDDDEGINDWREQRLKNDEQAAQEIATLKAVREQLIERRGSSTDLEIYGIWRVLPGESQLSGVWRGMKYTIWINLEWPRKYSFTTEPTDTAGKKVAQDTKDEMAAIVSEAFRRVLL